MTERTLPSVERLRQRLDYNPETGELTWKHCAEMSKNWNGKFAGKPALNCINGSGYRTGAVDWVAMQAHRVIWAMVHGEWPADQIDHINRVRHDNRLSNLRAVSGSENCRNRKLIASNTSGVCGVGWDKESRKWAAIIKVNGKQRRLGRFKSFNDAVAARKEAENMLGFHHSHGKAA